MLRRLVRRRRGIGRPERRSRAAYGLALFGVLGLGLAAAVAMWPLEVLPQAAANEAGPGSAQVVVRAGVVTAGTVKGPASQQPDGRAHPAAVAGPDLLFPKPSLGPPRQFPLKPTPSPPATTPAPPPPSKPAPPPPPTVAPKPPPPASVAPPTPSPPPTPTKTKTPAPRPAEILPLPAPPYHVPPHKQLSRVLVVFVVGIVPVSLARIRR